MRKWAGKIFVPLVLVSIAAAQSFGIDASRAMRLDRPAWGRDSIGVNKDDDSVSRARHTQDSIRHIQDSLRHIQDSIAARHDSILSALEAQAAPLIGEMEPFVADFQRRLDAIKAERDAVKGVSDSLAAMAADLRSQEEMLPQDSVKVLELDSLKKINDRVLSGVESSERILGSNYIYLNSRRYLARLHVRQWEKDSIYIDSLKAKIDSFGVDFIDSLEMVRYDSLKAIYAKPRLGVRDTIRVPEHLKDEDPLFYRYYVTVKDTAELRHVRDSLRNEGDSMELHLLDSLYAKDSAQTAAFKHQRWYSSLSKIDRKKYDYEQALPAKIHQMDSIMKRKDSLKAVKDSIIEKTPRILSSYVLLDTLRYKRIVTWTHDRRFNDINVFKLDTTYNYHYYDLPIYKKDYEVSYLGVAGSAAQSYNFFKRDNEEHAIFYSPYQVYSYTASSLPMYNTKTPYTELAYWGTLFSSREKEESNIKILTTQNITPELNLTLEYHRFGGRGLAQNESTDNRTAVIAANYTGKRYLMHTGYIYNKVRRTESGGLVDQEGDFNWIRDTTVKDVREIGVYLSDANSVTKKHTIFLDQSYRIPFTFINKIRDKRADKKAWKHLCDSILTSNDTLAIQAYNEGGREALEDLLASREAEDEEFEEGEDISSEEDEGEEHEHAHDEEEESDVDITSAYIGHSSELSTFARLYNDKIQSGDTHGRELFQNYYYNPVQSSDSMRVLRLDNKVYLRLQPWKADGIVSKLDVGVGDKYVNYYDFNRGGYLGAKCNVPWNSVYLYAGVKGQYKKYLKWGANGNYTFAGKEVNDFGVDADVDMSFFPFRRYKDSPLNVNLHFETTLKEPDWYQRHFHSNHFMWDNDFSKISTTKAQVGVSIPKWKFDTQVSYALLGNQTYFDPMGISRQHDGAMSVISAAIHKDFVLWKFHLDNKVLLQFSTNQDVVPLPLLTLNLRYYFQFNVVKNVMQMQVGLNGFYNTRWYAPAYNPVLGVFHNQNEAKYGNCAYVDAFVNVQWKRACIFLKVHNLNQGWPWKEHDYFSAHHYIKPGRTFKLGIFWPFYVQPGKKHASNDGAGGGHDHHNHVD